MCIHRCIKWQLPASCQLKQPADGQCCPVPDCPPNVKLVYPPGYEQKATGSVPGTQTVKSETTVLGTDIESSPSGTGGSIAAMNIQSMQDTKIDSTGKIGGIMTGKDMQMGKQLLTKSPD